MLGLNVSSDGRLELSVELYDRDDNLLGHIDENEWVTGDSFPWDLQYGERWLRIQSKQQEVSLFIDARQQPMVFQGILWFRKQRFDLTPDSIRINGGSSISNLSIVGGSILATTDFRGFQLVPNSGIDQSAAVREVNADTQGHGQENHRKFAKAPRRPASQLPRPHKHRKQ